jgi:hypothetical protein
MARVLGLAALSLVAVLYYYAFGPVPTPSELGSLPWWRPRGWALRTEALAFAKQLRDAGGASRLAPVLLFSLPPAALAGYLLVAFRSALARVVIVALALTSAAFVYYGYLAEGIWRFFDWRAPAATASFFLLIAAIGFAPSLLRQAGRRGTAGLALAVAAAFLLLYLLSTEITGTNPELALNLSPWPVLTLFGLLLVGRSIAALHVAAGLGGWIAARTRGSRGGWLAAAIAAAAGAAATAIAFFPPPPAAMVVFALVSAIYARVAFAGAGDRLGAGRARFVAGAALAVAILLSNEAATRNQANTRDVMATGVVAALDGYRAANGSYPDSLEQLVPDHLAEVPRPRMGWIPNAHEEFTYSNFGDSFALEFASVQWVQCAYSPAYLEAFDEGDLDDEGGVPPDVASGEEPGLKESWSCESRPPDLW